MSRRIARENIFKLVFEYLFCSEQNEVSLLSAVQSTEEKDKQYVEDVYKLVVLHSDSTRELIKKYSRDFSYERIYKVDLAILNVAVCEMLHYGIPCQISVNEAVEIAKKYSTEKSPAFINGVLAGIISESGAQNESKDFGRQEASR